MPSYTLTYFDGRGFGEAARQLFHLGKVPFKDVRVPMENLTPGKESEEWLEIKKNAPFGRLPILKVDDWELPQSAAICRYLARKFGLAGKTPEEEAMADAIVDQYKDFVENFRPVVYATRFGKSEEEIREIRETTFLPARDSWFKILNKLLQNSDFLVGNSLTWADLAVADSLFTLRSWKTFEEGNKEHQRLITYQEKIYGLPELREWIAKRPVTEM